MTTIALMSIQTDSVASAELAAAAPRKKRRIASLDWARGWMLVASVCVNSLLVIPGWFGHAAWEGINPLDWIFPTFVTLSGCGLAFALGRVVKPGPLVKRCVVLMLVGLVYNAVMDWSVDVFTWRITGILQLYAALVALVSLLHLVTKTWQGWAALTAVLAIAHSSVILSYGSGCPAGVTTPSCNPSGPIDSLLFGAAHTYTGGSAGYDSEGVVVIFGALVSAAAGATVGHLLQARSRRAAENGGGPTNAILPLLGTAVYFLALAVFVKFVLAVPFGADLPAMKRLWTAPFALIIAAATAIMLLIGHLLLDRSNVSPWFKLVNYPLLSLGRNSLFVYFGSHVLTSVLGRRFFDGESVASLFTAAMPSLVSAQVLWTAGLLAFWVVVATILNTKKIYLRP